MTIYFTLFTDKKKIVCIECQVGRDNLGHLWFNEREDNLDEYYEWRWNIMDEENCETFMIQVNKRNFRDINVEKWIETEGEEMIIIPNKDLDIEYNICKN